MGSVAKLKGARNNKSEGGGEVSPPLLFIAFFTSYRSPLSERLEQATGYISCSAPTRIPSVSWETANSASSTGKVLKKEKKQ